jgi:hypothetical protein
LYFIAFLGLIKNETFLLDDVVGTQLDQDQVSRQICASYIHETYFITASANKGVRLFRHHSSGTITYKADYNPNGFSINGC